MNNWILEFGKDEFCSLRNEKTGEIFIWKKEKLTNERKNYVNEHKKYLRYLERCEKGSKNEKEKTAIIRDKHERAIRIVNHQFHCMTREIIDVALDNCIKKIVVIKHDEKDRRYKQDDFGTFNMQWFYQKLNYKTNNVGIQLEYKEKEMNMKPKTS